MPIGVYKRKPNQKYHPLHSTWRGMHERCRRKKSASYPNYGGRGIKVCHRWFTFQNFVEDMGNKPSAIHTLDRIDTNGDYCPENCRWSDRYVQSRNSRHAKRVEYNDKVICISELSEITGITASTIYSRYSRGWRGKELIDQPSHVLEHNGVTKTWAQWSSYLGIPYNTILKRAKCGWKVDRILEGGMPRSHGGVPHEVAAK